jgi:hypothetical protein
MKYSVTSSVKQTPFVSLSVSPAFVRVGHFNYSGILLVGLRKTSVMIAVSEPRFESHTSRIRSKRTRHSTAIFAALSFNHRDTICVDGVHMEPAETSHYVLQVFNLQRRVGALSISFVCELSERLHKRINLQVTTAVLVILATFPTD